MGKATTVTSCASYTTKDIILYALGIGCTSSLSSSVNAVSSPSEDPSTTNKNSSGNAVNDICKETKGNIKNEDSVLGSLVRQQKADIGNTWDAAAEMKYIYEYHPFFRTFPLYPLALAFHARDVVDGGREETFVHKDISPSWGIQPFPPPGGFLGGTGENRTQFLSQFLLGRRRNGGKERDARDKEGSNAAADGDCEAKEYPIIHVSQSMQIHRSLPVPRSEADFGRNFSETYCDATYDPLVKIYMKTRIVRVIPKNVGAFVTTETEFRHIIPPAAATQMNCRNNNARMTSCNGEAEKGGCSASSYPNYKPDFPVVCVARSTFLVRGIPIEHVIPYDEKKFKEDDKINAAFGAELNGAAAMAKPARTTRLHVSTKLPKTSRIIEMKTGIDQALLYRLSGDYNPIHVDGNAAFRAGISPTTSEKSNLGRMKKMPKPILHGLCTLGYAIRAALLYWEENQSLDVVGPKKHFMWEHLQVTFISVKFTIPVAVGSIIRVFLWDGKSGLENDKVRDSRIKPPKSSENIMKVDYLALTFQVYDHDNRLVLDEGVIEAKRGKSDTGTDCCSWKSKKSML